MLVGARIKQFCAAGPDAFDFCRVMHRQPRAFVQRAAMRKDVPTARLVDVEANHLTADRALGRNGMKPTPSDELEELHDPRG